MVDSSFGFLADDKEDMDNVQEWMQKVYDDLGIETVVPEPPDLDKRQQALMARNGFRLFYVPRIEERKYPPSFVKLDWDMVDWYRTKRWPLEGWWLLVETVAQPKRDADFGPGDRFARKLGLKSRVISWPYLYRVVRHRAARLIGLPKSKRLRVPTAEEWNFLGNLFNWLREHRGEKLPDLGQSEFREWSESPFESDYRCLTLGGNDRNGLAGLGDQWRTPLFRFGFRLVAEF